MKKILILAILMTMLSCVSKHPKCAAYDNVNYSDVK